MTNPASSQTRRNPVMTMMLLRLLREIWWYMRLKYYVGVRRSLLIDWRTDWASQRPQICAQTNPFPNADCSSAWTYHFKHHAEEQSAFGNGLVWRTDWASQRPQICAQTNPFPNADCSSAWCLK